MGATTDEQGLLTTGDAVPRGGAPRTGEGCSSPAGRPAKHTAGNARELVRSPGADARACQGLRLRLTQARVSASAPAPAPAPDPAPKPDLAQDATPAPDPGSGPGPGPGPGPRPQRARCAGSMVCVALQRVSAFAARARTRLRPSAILATSVLERVRDWSCAMRCAREVRKTTSVPTFEEAAESARKEWLHAISYFDQVVDPDLIDYATYSVRAAERKYVYLLKKAREESASASHIATR
ncbi:MAG: hypothetical protein PWR07_2235 [Bacillota bacterium]|nr:hypothetical protein [Bacillota bacterium]